jgi:hypothetical protein
MRAAAPVGQQSQPDSFAPLRVLEGQWAGPVSGEPGKGVSTRESFVNEYVLETIAADGKSFEFVTVKIENIPAGWRVKESYRVIAAAVRYCFASASSFSNCVNWPRTVAASEACGAATRYALNCSAAPV